MQETNSLGSRKFTKYLERFVKCNFCTDHFFKEKFSFFFILKNTHSFLDPKIFFKENVEHQNHCKTNSECSLKHFIQFKLSWGPFWTWAGYLLLFCLLIDKKNFIDQFHIQKNNIKCQLQSSSYWIYLK